MKHSVIVETKKIARLKPEAWSGFERILLCFAPSLQHFLGSSLALSILLRPLIIVA